MAIAALCKFVELNAQKNKFTSSAKKANDELHKAMLAAKLDSITSTATVMGNTGSYTGIISAQSADYIDVEVLKGLVSEDDFIKIVTASMSAVTTVAGSNISMLATRTKMKPASLSVTQDKT